MIMGEKEQFCEILQIPEEASKQFTVRITRDLYLSVEKIAQESNRSRNQVIQLLLEYAVKHAKVTKK